MSGPLRLAVDAPGARLPGVRTLHQPFALVGRDQRADLPLEDLLVSRRHAYLQVVEGCLFWFDLDSRHGTGGPRGRGACDWLAADEAMRIGPYEIRRLLDDDERRDALPPASTPLIAESYGSAPWPKVSLEFLNGPSRSTVWSVNRVMSLVGSAAGCKLRLADPSVAPFHCSLVRTSSGVWIVDLLGGGGVMINNVVVRHAPLADGDMLNVGRYQVRVRDRVEDATSRAIAPALALPRPPRPAILAPRVDGSPPLPGHRPGLPALASEPETTGERPAPLELMPAFNDVLAAEGETGRIGESVLIPLVNQFGIMQQQMLDQFQNAMGMLVEMFGSLQREQMDLIRRELDQLREVTREFQELKLELATLARDRDRPAAAAPAAPAVVAAESRPAKPPIPVPVPAPSTPAPAPEPVAAAAAPERPAAKRGSGESDVMLWLNQRIATLQEERESRWRKILKLLPSAS